MASDIEQINHEELAISRLATEYRESTNLINYIKTLLAESDNLEQVYQDIYCLRWIDTAFGAQLDVIGEIVGQPRELVNASLLYYFGFFDFPTAQSFGTVDDPSVGGEFRTEEESVVGNRLLEDEEYRFYIKGRIAKNSIIPTVNNMEEFFNYIFGTSTTYVFDYQDMSYSVAIGRVLTPNEQVFLLLGNVVPKVAAVRIRDYITFDENQAFGFLGVPVAKGFGSLSDPTVGGKFGSIVSLTI